MLVSSCSFQAILAASVSIPDPEGSPARHRSRAAIPVLADNLINAILDDGGDA